MTLIDVNHLKVLAALGVKPHTVGEEIESFKELSAFFVQARARRPGSPIIWPSAKDGEEGEAAAAQGARETVAASVEQPELDLPA